MHHLRTLRIMSDVYSKGLLTDLQLEGQMVEKMFPMLEDLLELHSFFFSALLERKKEGKLEETDGFMISRIGDVLVSQVRTFDFIYILCTCVYYVGFWLVLKHLTVLHYTGLYCSLLCCDNLIYCTLLHDMLYYTVLYKKKSIILYWSLLKHTF